MKLTKITVGIIICFILTTKLYPQGSQFFYFSTLWEVMGIGMGYNIEKADMNRDGHDDIIVANFRDTYLYYGGPGILDTAKDLIYKGRCLSILDYNGDGFQDMICMNLTTYDSSLYDYKGEMIYYMGSDTTSILIDTIPDYVIPLPTQYPMQQDFAITYLGFDAVETGDFNNDGKKDFVITSRYWPASPVTSHSARGKLYVYLGKSVPQYSPDFEIEGQNNAALLGMYFGVGDINGDQYDDLLFSSKTKNMGELGDTSILYIFYGSNSPNFVLGQESKKYKSHTRENIKWGEWFTYRFSVDDINDDGFADVVVGRSNFLPRVTNIHYGSPNGIDTIPKFIITNPDTAEYIWAGSTSQGIGDYNKDGYEDFVIWGGYRTFSLYLGGPYISNQNEIGLLGFLGAMYGSKFPCTALMVSDQTGNGEKELLCNARSIDSSLYGYAFMVYGNSSIHTDIKEENKANEYDFKLENNYPNPFNPTTIVSYQLSVESKVTLKVYDVLGKEVATLADEEQAAGKHKYEFNSTNYNLSSGVYLYQLNIGGNNEVKKMVLMK